MGAMSDAGSSLPEPCQGRVRPPAVTRHQDDARPESGKPGGGNLSDTGRGASDNHDLAVNRRLPELSSGFDEAISYTNSRATCRFYQLLRVRRSGRGPAGTDDGPRS